MKKEVLRTITIGAGALVQGVFVSEYPDGRIVVRVEGQEFVGTPVKRWVA